MLPAASIAAYGGINKGNVNPDTDPWEAAETALGLFELTIFVIDDGSCDAATTQAIDPAKAFSAHSGLFILKGLKQLGFLFKAL